MIAFMAAAATMSFGATVTLQTVRVADRARALGQAADQAVGQARGLGQAVALDQVVDRARGLGRPAVRARVLEVPVAAVMFRSMTT